MSGHSKPVMGRPIAGNFDKFGGLAVWIETAKLKSANINFARRPQCEMTYARSSAHLAPPGAPLRELYT